MRSPVALLTISLILVSACSLSRGDDESITTSQTAIAKARQAWKSMHEKNVSSQALSDENIARFEPYSAVRDGDVWIIKGTIPKEYHGDILETKVQVKGGAVSVTYVTK